MGLFDIFRRHKKKEDDVSSTSSADSQSATSTSETELASTVADTSAVSDDALSATDKAEVPVNIPPAVSHEEKIDVNGNKEVLHDGVEKGVGEDQTDQASADSESNKQSEAETSDQIGIASAESSQDSTEEESSSSTEQEATPASEDQTKETSLVAENLTDQTTPAADSKSSAETSADSATSNEDETTEKYDRGLEKSRTGFGARLNKFLANFRHVDEAFFDDLEDMLIESDVGYDMAMKLSDELREEVKLQNAKSKQDVSNVIIEKMVDLYDEAGQDENPDLAMAKEGPTVIMFVGVNGAGKTTTIGKMAALFKKQGKKVLLAAADTFRAGATEQLDVWAKRDDVDIVTGPENGDPAAVVFDAVKKAKEEDYDVLFVDTAGRLQNKVNLMNELAKMKRILTREIPSAPHEVLLVLDATTGQNALNQAKLFKESTDVTGIVLTKLDGTARGGIVLAIRNELHLPVKYVGLGEKVDDLQKFDASDFVYGLFKGLVEVD
ncbi:signal recognition particle-docking protein FtsY [Limosilactobacillus sp. STM2_1]|uniref:Signal recognition particle receptor FtsY n=1 Tax=Limosilactobacillus rudii TaxID=2759755 RepID=A0A7W3UJH0_9LACO|nr:signal recognition particle-docking protein FtsY [Limosilactobacillus rudii]MBB1080182.1 signal recognition particle-docking protein FtsY [Limosilactobacillus rudii]MBB1096697.1 signal recognition particle-docking protein FtsY [Limosilactobacillus rudii]MCD7133670.1 signal recognition particle-docking protein FtsY [Limosilactobacillus rudii]